MTFFSVTARAEVDIKRAKEHFAKAQQLYKIERFADALTEYQEAYLSKPEPNLLFNMGQCERLMGNRGDALRFYRRFLIERPNPPNLTVVQQHIRDLEAAEATGATAPPPGPAPAVTAPPPQPSMRKGFVVAPSPASASVSAVAYGQPGASGAVGAHPAAVALGSTSPPPVAPLPLPPQSLAMAHEPGASNLLRADGSPGSRNNDEDRPVYKKWWFWTAIGVVVASVVVIGVAAGHKSDPSCQGLASCR
ncbi:MAG TPA: tetratricopeptide repeat protein [Polyangia bacterium]|nr:tetratricopeptide repeat protein [Polyangia bacterium]